MFAVFARAESQFNLNEDYYYFQNHKDEVFSKDQVTVLNRFHFVFVAGFLNEGARKRYFKDNMNALKQNGIETVSVIFPSSKKSISDNLDRVGAELMKAYTDGGSKPLIVFGHSKGGLEAIAYLLQHAETLRLQISKVIAIQSPINGNEFLDHWIAPPSIHLSSLDGMNSLRAHEVEKVIHQKFLLLNSEQKNNISSNVYFISTSRMPSEVSFLFRIPSYMMLHYLNEPSDGIVATKNMTFDLFGKVLGHVKADHTELVISHVPGLNISSEQKTRAFTMAVFKNLLNDLNVK